MSNLQISLAIAGGLALVAVVAHSAWSNRRNAPKQAAPLPSVDQDPNMDGLGLQQEPSLDPFPESASPLEKQQALNPLLDAITPMTLTNPVSGEAVLAALPASRRVGSKPFAVEGQQHADGSFEAPAPGRRYVSLQAGVQLANRMGHLNEIEYSEFVMKVQHVAEALGALPDLPDMLEQVARAKHIDEFAATHDAQLSFTLRARHAAWSPGYIQQHAGRLGFVPGTLPGRLVLPASEVGMPPMLVLNFDPQAALAEDPEHTALRDVRLSLDVAQVDRAEQPFVRLREAAAWLAQEMDGVITDDTGQLLTETTLDSIGADLEQLYDAYEAKGMPAGSALARRLFS